MDSMLGHRMSHNLDAVDSRTASIYDYFKASSMDYALHDAFVMSQLVRDFVEATCRGEVLSLRDYNEKLANGTLSGDRVLCYTADKTSQNGAWIPIMFGFESSVCTTYDELFYTVKVRILFTPSGRAVGFAVYAKSDSVDDAEPLFVWRRRNTPLVYLEGDSVPDPFGGGLFYISNNIRR